MRKKLACCLATLMVGGALLSVGCSGPQKGNEKKEDLTKTQLFVGDDGGGMGGTWFNNLISEFETKYADYEFEGKKYEHIKVGKYYDTDAYYVGKVIKVVISSTSSRNSFMLVFSSLKIAILWLISGWSKITTLSKFFICFHSPLRQLRLLLHFSCLQPCPK